MDWTKETSLVKLWEPKKFLRDRRLLKLHTELPRLQKNSPYTFGLHSNALSREKVSVVCCLMQLHIISSSGIIACIQGTYSVVQNF